MTEDTERPTPAETLRAHGLRPQKRLGQNFLSDPAILASIVDAAELTPADVVLEVGPGTGLLTRMLAERAGRVVAVELDAGLAAACRATFAGTANVSIVEGDALERGVPSGVLRNALGASRARAGGGGSWKLVANLPYQIAAPLLVGLFQADPPACAVVTIQREVADRLRAAPGTEHYGALSVRFQLLSTIEVVRHLPPGAFWPRPKVRSTVVRCRPLADPPEVPPAFDAVLRALFDHRRKQAPAALATAGVCDRARAVAALDSIGIPREMRGEALEPVQICALAELLDAPADDR